MWINELCDKCPSFKWMIIGLIGLYLMKLIFVIHDHIKSNRFKSLLIGIGGTTGLLSFVIWSISTIITIYLYW